MFSFQCRWRWNGPTSSRLVLESVIANYPCSTTVVVSYRWLECAEPHSELEQCRNAETISCIFGSKSNPDAGEALIGFTMVMPITSPRLGNLGNSKGKLRKLGAHLMTINSQMKTISHQRFQLLNASDTATEGIYIVTGEQINYTTGALMNPMAIQKTISRPH
jgi:hypothetical protein